MAHSDATAHEHHDHKPGIIVRWLCSTNHNDNEKLYLTFAVVFGIILLGTPDLIDWGAGWIWVKLVFVIGMGAVHGFYSRWRRDFEADRNQRSARFYRAWNEVPTVLMIVIVIMVIVRPF